MSRTGKREALIVAVSDYRDPMLRDPEVGGFDIEVVRDPEERASNDRCGPAPAPRTPPTPTYSTSSA